MVQLVQQDLFLQQSKRKPQSSQPPSFSRRLRSVLPSGQPRRDCPDLCRLPQTKRKSVACRLSGATPPRITGGPPSWGVTPLPGSSSAGGRLGEPAKTEGV